MRRLVSNPIVVTVLLVLATLSEPVFAQQHMVRVGILTVDKIPPVEAFYRTLSQHGWIEGTLAVKANHGSKTSYRQR